MKITTKQIEICERLDWIVHIGSDYVELESWSPAGENLVFCLDNDEDFVEEIKCLAAEFNTDKHVEMFVGGRGKNGVPETIRELLEDADAIDQMLQNLASALDKEEPA